MKSLFNLILILFCASNLFAQEVPDPANDNGWVLQWSDEFNQSTIDQTKWNVYNDFDHFGREIVFRDDNVKTENGNLVLTYKTETYSCATANINHWACRNQLETGNPYEYTGARVDSKQPYNFKYGYLEARVKLDYGFAVYPTIWTFIGEGETSSNPNLPYNPNEIDLFEMTTGSIPNAYTMTSNVHVEYCDVNSQYWDPVLEECPNWPYDYYQADNIGNWDDVYRIWSLEWNPDDINIFVDGVLIRSIPNPGVVDPVKTILGIGMDHNDYPTTPKKDMLIDYIKVYQLDMDCEEVVDDCSFWFGGYDEGYKKSIRIGYGGCGNSQPSNTDLYLRATDYIELHGDFTVPLGAEMTAEIVECLPITE